MFVWRFISNNRALHISLVAFHGTMFHMSIILLEFQDSPFYGKSLGYISWIFQQAIVNSNNFWITSSFFCKKPSSSSLIILRTSSRLKYDPLQFAPTWMETRSPWCRNQWMNLDCLRPFDQWELLDCNGHGPSVLCTKWPRARFVPLGMCCPLPSIGNLRGLAIPSIYFSSLRNRCISFIYFASPLYGALTDWICV